MNDLSSMGARPLYLTASFILETGLDTDVLGKIVQSMKETAEEAGVRIVAGDTKVIEGKAGYTSIRQVSANVLPRGIFPAGI